MSRFAFALLLAALLSACAFYVSPDPAPIRVRPLPSSPDIVVSEPEVLPSDLPSVTLFSPGRGEGSVYNLGEEITFELSTTRSGYVTLTSYGPDGAASVFAQNIYVPGGLVTLPTAESQVSYTLAPPRGLQRVTASFSSSTSNYAQDTAETTFYIQ
jgi:hypothetical protein